MAIGLAGVLPVLAAMPPNDDSSNATVITSFPYVATVDMGEATLQPSEPSCGDVTGSVWYRYTATAEQTLTVAVAALEQDTRVCVLPDSIGAGTYRVVQPSETVPIILDAGRTYYILLGVTNDAAFATLDLALGPPLLDVQVTVDATGRADRVSGAAIVSGTLRCSEPTSAFLQVRVVQKLGSKRTVDWIEQRWPAPCPTTPTPWQMVLHAPLAYVPGSASVSIYVGAAIYDIADVDEFTTSVRLRAK